MKKKTKTAIILILGVTLAVILTLRLTQEKIPEYVLEQNIPEEIIAPAPSPVPTQTPEPTPGLDPLEARALELLEDMSTHEKICQLFVVYPQAVEGINGSMLTGLEQYPVGGFLYDMNALAALGREGVIQRNAELQEWMEIDLIITADEEGGRVKRLMSALGTNPISAMFSYKDGGTQMAYDNAAIIAGDLQGFGFNTNLAPVADVWSNRANTVIGDRAFSDDFSQAAELVSSAVSAYKDAGLICTLKHFPGHGDTFEDSHSGAAIVTKSVEEMESAEFLPFISGIEAGADMVMVGHLTVNGVSSVPATVSPEIVSGLLRERLGFDGVIISDGLEMSAVTKYYGGGELEVLAFEAGIDILLAPAGLEVSVAAITEAVESGRISVRRLDESVLRILRMKLENGIIE